MFDSVPGRERKRKKREPKMGRPRHPLCPCQVTLGRFTSNLMNFVNPQNYKAVACIETIPAWLDFLESQGLIDEAKHARGLADIRPLCDNLKKSADYFSFDPMLKEAVEAL